MKKFLMASSFILISTFIVFSQGLADKTNKDETLAFTEKKPELNKVKFDIIKDEKIELNKDELITKFTPEKNKTIVRRQGADDDYNKNEFFVGYSYQNVDRGGRANFHGVNASYVRNITRYIGIKGDVSGVYNNDSFSFTGGVNNGSFTLSGDTNSQIYNFLGGVQFKDNASKKKLKPFAHLLAGIAHQRFETTSRCSGDCTGIVTGRSNFNDTSFSAAFGGGLDIKINDKIDFRAIQFDYNPIFSGSSVTSNFRVGIGIVFK